jgi:signal transduction histidine kinase
VGIFKAALWIPGCIEILIMNNITTNKIIIDKVNGIKLFKQLIFLFIIQSFFLYSDVQFARADSRIVTVGVYENAPKVFTSEDGKPSGVFIDVIEQISKTEGWNLKYVSGTWGEGLDRVKKGEIDLMPDVAYTADREKIYSFHKIPVLSSWYQVYAPKGSNIRSILDLKEKRILVLERSVQEAAFVKLNKGFGLNSTLIPVPDYKTMFEIVARGDADAAITNRFYGIMHAKKYGIEDTTLIFEPSDLFFAATKGDPKSLLDTIDSRLSDLKKDSQSTYYVSLKRWTSEEVQFKFPVWLQILGIVAGIALLMSLVGSSILKRQVNMRTRELIQINKEMEQRIIKRTAELAAAMEKAQAADRIKSAFLATMSHELRTPLNSIIGFTGIMLQGLAGPLNEEQHKQMVMIQNSSRHLLSLINDVLDISKIEAGQLELSNNPFELRPSIEKMVKLISPLAEKKNLDLKLDIAENVGAIIADQRRLEQIILNLLNNAVKFTEKGYVHISCRMENAMCILSVADTGIGMMQDELPKLFQPFYQIDSGTTRKAEGTGLGLSICRKILELMNGSIVAQSEFGKGSVFTISFPAQMEGKS